MRFEVDWGDVGDPEADWPEADTLPPVDVTGYLDSSWVEAGGARLGRSTNPSTRADGRVGGRIRLENRGEWTTGRGGTWDNALARPHLFRLRTGPPATARKVQQVGIAELVDSDAETAELSITSRYPLVDGEVPDATDDEGNTVPATTAGNKTVTAFVNVVLTAARVGDSATLQKPAPRATIADTIRVGAAVDQVEISGSVADAFTDVGLACLGWWAEDWDGCPHFFGLVAAGQAARYATVDGTWRPLVGQGGVSRPTGLLRNQVGVAGTDQGAVREAIATPWVGEWSVGRSSTAELGIGNMKDAPNQFAQNLPALPSGSDISSAEYSDMEAEVVFGAGPGSWGDDTVFTPATLTLWDGPSTPRNEITWADWFTSYLDWPSPTSGYRMRFDWGGSIRRGTIGIRFTVYAAVRYSVARGFQTVSDQASILRHGPRAFPSQPDRFAAYGQSGQATALLNIFKGPPLVADLTIPLWHTTGLSPDPTSLRIGDRLRIAIPGTGWDFDAAVLTLRWQYDPGRMPTVRVLALQATATSTVLTPPPGPPTGLLVAASSRQLVLTWSPPVGGTTPAGYQVEWRTGTGAWSSRTVTATTTTLTGLTDGSVYQLRVRSTHTAGNSAWLTGSGTPAAPAPTVDAPGPPTGFAAAPGDGQATLTFAAATGAGVGAPTSYRVWYDTDANISGATEVSPAPTSSPVTITGLTNGTEYNFWVLAVNSAGQSALVGPVTATPAAAPVTPDAVAPSVDINPITNGTQGTTVALSAAVTGGTYDSLAYAWSVTGGDASLSGETTATPTLTRRSDAGNMTVSLTVTATGTGTNAADGTTDTATATETATATAPAATTPSAVRNLALTPGNDQFTATFDAPAQGQPTRYRLRYIIPPATTGHTSGVHDGSPITITGLTNGTTYEAQVRAEDLSGRLSGSARFGPWSAPLRVTPTAALPAAAAPAVTIDAIASGVAASTVDLSASISGGTYDTIAYTWAVTGGDASLSGETTAAPTLTRRSDAGAMTVSLLVEVDGTGTVARAGTTDNVTASASATATAPAVLPAAAAPAVTIAAIPVGLVSATVDLSAAVTGGTYDSLAYAWSVTGGDASLANETTATPTLTRRSDAGAMTVSLTVTATGTGTVARTGTTDTATDAENATSRALTVPGVPQSLSVTAAPTRLSVVWGAPVTGDPPTGYTVEWTAGGVGVTANVTDATTRDITGLTDGVEYSVRVRAYNAAGNGPWTAALTATPGTVALTGPTFRVVRFLTNNRTANIQAVGWDAPDGYSAASSARAEVEHRTGTSGAWAAVGATANTRVKLEAGFWMAFAGAGFPKFVRGRIELQPDGTSDAASRVWSDWQETEFASRSGGEPDSEFVAIFQDGRLVTLDGRALGQTNDLTQEDPQ